MIFLVTARVLKVTNRFENNSSWVCYRLSETTQADFFFQNADINV